MATAMFVIYNIHTYIFLFFINLYIPTYMPYMYVPICIYDRVLIHILLYLFFFSALFRSLFRSAVITVIDNSLLTLIYLLATPNLS